jgi:hypothetical protein
VTWDEPDGTCVDCGAETEQDHHWRCPSCYRKHQGWDTRGDEPDEPRRDRRPPAGTPPESFVAGLADVRRQLADLVVVVAGLERRLRDLERRRAA